MLIWSASPTPFLENGELDEAGLAGLVEQHGRFNVTGLFLACSCGEGQFMPNGQRAELVRIVRRQCGPRLHLSALASDTTPERVRRNMAEFRDAGADAAFLTAPPVARYGKREAVRRYFLESIESAPLPVGVYALPTPPEQGLTSELWAELARHPGVQWIKDTTRNEACMRALTGVGKQRDDLLVLSGDEFDIAASVKAGYDGFLLGTGVLIAGMVERMLAALEAGDREACAAWQSRSNTLLYDLFCRDLSLWPSGLKYALVQMGVFTSEFSHLRRELTDEDRARIDAALEREGEFIRPVREGVKGKD